MASSAVALSLLMATPALAHTGVSLGASVDAKSNAGFSLGSALRVSHGDDDDKNDHDKSKNDNNGKHEDKSANVTVSGTVSAVSGSTITLAGSNGTTYTVDVSHATISDRNDASVIANVAVGDMLVVKGTLAGSVITAKKIRDTSFVHRAFLSAIGAAGAGVVTKVDGSTFTLKSRGVSGTTTVTTNASTTYKVNGVATTSSALGVGSRAIVFGSTDASGSITATLVSILNAGANFFVRLFH